MEDQEREQKLLRAVLEGTSTTTGEEFLRRLVRLLAAGLGAHHAFVATRVERGSMRLRCVAAWNDDGFADPTELDLAGTSSEPALNLGRVHRFSLNAGDRGSHLGIPVPGADGTALGLLAVAEPEEEAFRGVEEWVFRVLAARAGAEIERLRAVRGLQRSESQYRALVEQLPVVTYLARLDDQLSAEYVSPQIEETTGFSQDEWCVRPSRWQRQLHPDDRDAVLANLFRNAERGEPFVDEYRMLTRDGREIWIRDQGQAVHDRQGRPVVFQGIMCDVTAEKRLGEELLNGQKLEALSVLAGGVAHEFNNLLTTVLANVSLGREELPQDSPSRKRFERIEQAANRAADLTREMLAFSGKGRYVVEALDLSDLVREMSPLLQTLRPSWAEIELELAEDLPPVEADAGQMRQILINLLTNASDALEKRHGSILIRTARVTEEELAGVAAPASGQHVLLEVADGGVGMDEETQGRAFDPFFSTKFAGRGLGLAAVLGIVRGHRGAIRLESEPGGGTSVRVLLPASSAAESREAASPFDRPEVVDARTILVVDDDEGVQAVARSMLEAEGYEVITAGGGTEGLDLYRRHAEEISAVLVDLTMPETGGDEVFDRLRRVNPGARVILMSGYDEARAIGALAGDPSAYVQKPFRSEELLGALRRALDS